VEIKAVPACVVVRGGGMVSRVGIVGWPRAPRAEAI
jgi:hypothetical protein